MHRTDGRSRGLGEGHQVGWSFMRHPSLAQARLPVLSLSQCA
jgi:hypothetical protein